MPKFVESGLEFDFDDERWRVVQWDKHPAHCKGVGKLGHTKAVDFAGLIDSERLYLVEVRNQVSRPRTEKKNEEGSIEVEFGRKVRDTIAGLVGAYRDGQHPDVQEMAMRVLARDRRAVVLVLWYEHPRPPVESDSVYRARLKGTLATFRDRVGRKLRWLRGTVQVCATAIPNSEVDGLRVAPAPASQ